jgi:hypothetical protein
MKLHDTQPIPVKRKNQSPLRVIVNKWGFLLSALMLGMGVIVGLAAAVFAVPSLLGFDITATALAEEAFLLAATESDLNLRDRNAVERETQFALNAQATLLGMMNAENLLDQTATQSLFNIYATATANAAADSRQRTQIALDYAATQVQLQNNATQVQLDYQNTQAALGQGGGGGGFESQTLMMATSPAVAAQANDSASGGFEAQSLLLTPFATVTATPFPPTPTSTVMLPPPSDTATVALDAIDTDFRAGMDAQYWIERENEWTQTQRGMQAQTNRALLLSRDAVWDDNYTLTVTIAPAIVLESTYTLLLHVADGDALAVEIDTSGLAADMVRLMRLKMNTDDGQINFDTAIGTIIVERDVDEPLTSDTRFIVAINNGTVSVQLNNTEILTTSLTSNLASGQVGVLLPQGSTLQAINVERE